jgi:hypothetical protein
MTWWRSWRISRDENGGLLIPTTVAAPFAGVVFALSTSSVAGDLGWKNRGWIALAVFAGYVALLGVAATIGRRRRSRVSAARRS